MAGILRNNIKAFNKLYPYVEHMIEEAEKDSCREGCCCTNGIVYFEEEGKKYRVTSEYPLKETEILLRNINFKRDNLIIVFGMGNVAFLEKLIEKSSDDTRIAVFEPNIGIFKYIIKNNSLLGLINSKKIVFFTGPLQLAEKSMAYVFDAWINLVLNIEVISIPNYYVYSKYRSDCIERIFRTFRQQLANMGNSLEDTMIGIDNQYVNIDNCIAANSINEIKGKYKGYPAIIVSSGPSLDKNIDKLKNAYGKALIIACDASYRSCMANGVRPDMIASIERGIATYQFYYEKYDFPKEMVLIGPSVLRPEIFEKIPGKKIIMAKSGVGIEGWWMDRFDTIEFTDMGHSCATVAFSVAQAAGCSPIILMGQDLAYTDDKIHGDMAHTEYEGENKIAESDESLWTKDIYGESIRTTTVYNTFRYYFESKISENGVRVVDATEGGAYISGSEIMTLEEAIGQFCIREIPFKLNDLLEDRVIDTEYRLKKYCEIEEAVKAYIEELLDVQAMARKFHKKIIHLRDYDFNNVSEEELIEILEKMSENNQMLPYLYNEHKNLLTYYMQNIRQTIINVKNLGNKITGENVYRNWVLQVNLIEMIDLASSVVINEFTKIDKFIKNKIEEEEKKCLKVSC